MENPLSGIDSIVMFCNSQNVDGRGTLMHITRRNVVFEVYNPFSIVQVSEVLSHLKVIRGDRTIYDGRAVVSSLLTTGIMVIVSATLVDPWSDLRGLEPGRGLKTEANQFLSDWDASHEINPNYQLAVSSVRNFLAELSKWMEEAEAGISLSSESLKEEFFEEVREPLAPKIVELYDKLEIEASQIPPEELVPHKSFARRELHPMTLCSPFVHRTYMKPLGYAGDYEMVNMMLLESENRNEISAYAKMVDNFHILTAAPKAHRNRIDMLGERLINEAERVISEERPFKVLNIGCGPAVELQRFIKNNDISNQSIFSLMDFNDETIDYARRKINDAISESNNKPGIKFIHKSIDVLLKEVYDDNSSLEDTYDFVYCAGLFDYLITQTCKNLIELFLRWVSSGGLVTVTNVHASNPNRHQMEHLLEWYLIYRDDNDMKMLIPRGISGEVIKDETGVNVFLDIRKED